MSFENLKYEVTDNHVGIITLNRPEAMNSMSYELYMELEDAVRYSEARVLIVTGEGRAFCAGDDVKQILGGTQGPPKESIARGKRTYGLTAAAEAMLYSDIPIIAAVNGPAVGWGMEIALMADIRIASEKAKFGELFVVRGLCCDAAGLGPACVHAVPASRARHPVHPLQRPDGRGLAALRRAARPCPRARHSA